VDDLPEEYQVWYHNLADVIDPVFRTSYVQSSVAWALAQCAFSSRLILSLRDADWRSIIPLASDLPNTRFNRLRAALAANVRQLYVALEQKFHTICHQQQVAPWEFQSEDAWELAHRGGDLVKRVDEQLVNETFNWLKRESGIECYDPASDGEAATDALNRLGRRLYLEIPKSIAQAFREAIRGIGGRIDLNNPGGEEQAVFIAMRALALLPVEWARREPGSPVTVTRGCPQAGAVVANRMAVAVRDEPADLLEGDSLFEKLSAVQILSAEPPDHLDHWILRGTPDCRLDVPLGTVLTGRFPSRLVLEWLDRRRALAAEGRRVPVVRSVTVAESSRFDGGRFLLERRTDAERRAVKDLLFGDLRAAYCLYWRGNWIDCLKEYATWGALRTSSFPFDRAVEGNRRSPEETADAFGDLAVMVLVADRLPGCVIRAFASHSAPVVMQEVFGLFQAGQIAAMSEDDRARVRGAVDASVKAIVTYWEEF
jgi:hypothetical protein